MSLGAVLIVRDEAARIEACLTSTHADGTLYIDDLGAAATP